MENKELKKGIFITFEGPEGCGKSTQSYLLFEYLKRAGYSCIYTREPGGTPVGEMIRKILLDSRGVRVSSLTELLLFEAARSALIRDIIRPVLERKMVVISDRFSDATFAYQGYAGGLDLGMIKKIDRIATGGLKPDITLLLDIKTSLGLARATKTARDRMEEKSLGYHVSVRQGYLQLAKEDPGRIRIIKAVGSIDKMQGKVRREVEGVIQKYSRSK